MAEKVSANIPKHNIVILGRTGAGKATVANSILGAKVFEVLTSLESVTREARHTFKRHTDTDRSINYGIKLIDTSSTFNTHDSKTLIDHCRLEMSEGINLIIFVFKQGRFTNEESKAFNAFVNLGTEEHSKISVLVVTGCENQNDAARKSMVDDIKSDPGTSDIAAFMKKGILPVGFPNLSEIDDDFKPVIQRKIEKDTANLRQLVCDICQNGNAVHLDTSINENSDDHNESAGYEMADNSDQLQRQRRPSKYSVKLSWSSCTIV